jgi:demethylspheroidene O-methyltransferase
VRSLADQWFRLRNRTLANPRFQRWAARFPLTRFIARRRASALFDMCAGFVYSQVLHATVQVGLLGALKDEPRTVDELAATLSLSPSALQRLVDAAVSLKLVQRRPGGHYGLGVHGAALLGNPGAAAMVHHHALLYRDLADPVALLRGEGRATELNRFWSYASHGAHAPTSERDVSGYSELMAGSLSLVAEDILEAHPLGRYQRLLDVGGGDGAFLQAAAGHAPQLALVLFDLPPVAARGGARLAQAGLASRTTVVGGDVFRDPLPKGADVVSLVRVIHDHDDPQALWILRAVRAAIAPGGTLLLAEPMAGTPGSEPMGDAYFGFYLLAMGQGRPRTAEHLGALLSEAGFGRVRSVKTRRPMLVRALAARAT